MKSNPTTISFKDMIELPERDRDIKPGWAVQLPNGGWLCYAHGWFVSKDPFYARRADTKEGAQDNLADAQEDAGGISGPFGSAKVVVAWEPYCAHLLFKIDELQRANTISPDTLFELIFELEGILSTLRGVGKSDKKEDENDL